MTPLVAAIATMAILSGALLTVLGLRPAPVIARPARTTLTSARLVRLARGPGRLSRRTRALLLAGGVAGLVVWLVTGWAVAVIILPVACAGVPALLTAEATNPIGRLDAMEEWTRSLAGVLTVGVGLEQAIIATLKSTPDPIRPEVATLVARLHARWPTAAALRALADDLDDATGDLIVSSLLLGSKRRGAGLAAVLEGLAGTVAEDARIRRSIEADRAKPRATARWITLITVGVLVTFAFNGTYIAPYGTGPGQAILLLLLSSYVGALLWMRTMAQGERLPRFIGRQFAEKGGPA